MIWGSIMYTASGFTPAMASIAHMAPHTIRLSGLVRRFLNDAMNGAISSGSRAPTSYSVLIASLFKALSLPLSRSTSSRMPAVFLPATIRSASSMFGSSSSRPSEDARSGTTVIRPSRSGFFRCVELACQQLALHGRGGQPQRLLESLACFAVLPRSQEELAAHGVEDVLLLQSADIRPLRRSPP